MKSLEEIVSSVRARFVWVSHLLSTEIRDYLKFEEGVANFEEKLKFESAVGILPFYELKH